MRRLLLALLLLSSPAWGAIYYVDPDCTDTNPASATVDGTEYNAATLSCTGGSDSYYVTIADVNAKSLSAGDSVLLKKGETWREQLEPAYSGTDGNLITYGSYGTGNRPVISGANIVTGFDSTSSWMSVFSQSLTAEATGTDDINLRAKFPANFLTGTGTKIRITVNAHSTEALSIDGMAIGVATGTMDFASTPTRITFNGGENTLSADANSETVSDEMTFSLDNTVVNIISSWMDNGRPYKQNTVTGPTSYYYAGTGLADDSQTANVADGSYNSTDDYIRIISKIEAYAGGGGNTWEAAVTTQPNIVRFNNVLGTLVDNTAEVDAEYEWYWANDVLTVYSTSDPDTAFTNPGIEASARPSCITDADHSYWKVTDIACRNSNLNGIQVVATGSNTVQGVVFDGNTSDNNYWSGFYVQGGATAVVNDISIINNTGSYNGRAMTQIVNAKPATPSNRIIIDNNIAAYNAQVDDSYSIATYAHDIGAINTYTTVSNCEVYGTNKVSIEGQGIDFDGDTGGNIAEYNYVHDNEGVGIIVGLYGDNNVVRYNLIVDNAGHGIEGSGSTITASNIYNNTIYVSNNEGSKYGIFLWNDGTYNVKNNIIYGDYEYGVVTNIDVATTCTNNLMYGYTVAATGGTASCTSSVTSDPLFVSTATPDFSLQSSSPAINAGVDVGLTSDFLGNGLSGAAWDIGAYEYQATSGPGSPGFGYRGGMGIHWLW